MGSLDDVPYDVIRDTEAELWPDSQLPRKIVCKVCDVTIFEHDVPTPTEGRRRVELARMGAHFEFSHDMMVRIGKCVDQTCLKFHIEAFYKPVRKVS